MCCQSSFGAVNITVSVTTDEAVTYDGMEYVLMPYSLPDNITYTCAASRGTILWQLGGCDESKVSYQMVDRDEFLINGIVIQDAMTGLSTLNIYRLGRMFLSSMLQSDVFTVQCLAVVDDVNVYSGGVHTIELYGMWEGPMYTYV